MPLMRILLLFRKIDCKPCFSYISPIIDVDPMKYFLLNEDKKNEDRDKVREDWKFFKKLIINKYHIPLSAQETQVKKYN